MVAASSADSCGFVCFTYNKCNFKMLEGVPPQQFLTVGTCTHSMQPQYRTPRCSHARTAAQTQLGNAAQQQAALEQLRRHRQQPRLRAGEGGGAQGGALASEAGDATDSSAGWKRPEPGGARRGGAPRPLPTSSACQ